MKTENIKIIPKWSRSKDEIWNEVFAGLKDRQVPSKMVSMRALFARYAAAAVVTLAVVLTSAAYLHTNAVVAAKGEHLAVSLPDGSVVNLNAESKLEYKPYWWFVSRAVTLEGEGYFEVQPGSQFTVRSGEHMVRVLGTSFNVFARAERYRVTCLTGKVEVAWNKQSVLLKPDMQAVSSNDRLVLDQITNASEVIGWIQGRFSFKGTPLKEVIAEIERQYNIRVVAYSNLDYLYTGNFSKAKEPREVLQIVGKPFNVEFKIK